MLSTKQLILKELSSPESANGFVSGEALAKKCGVSRTAVWKAVQSLLKEGVQIDAVTNRGYRMLGRGSCLSEDVLSSLASKEDETKALHFKVYQTIDSTNREAKRICANAGALKCGNGKMTANGLKLHKLVIIAEQQTAGHGRLGRAFYSPAQNGIYLSFIYIPMTNIIQPAKMTAAAAVAVCRAMQKVYNVDAKIKWVNDIFVNGKKVCGILTEGVTNFETGGIEAAIVGIGVNVCNGNEGFPENISNVAGSLLGAEKTPARRNDFAFAIVSELANLYDEEESCSGSEKSKQIMIEYKSRSFLLGKELEITSVIGQEETYMAKAVDITDEAALVVQLRDGTLKELQSGEVSLKSYKLTDI